MTMRVLQLFISVLRVVTLLLLEAIERRDCGQRTISNRFDCLPAMLQTLTYVPY